MKRDLELVRKLVLAIEDRASGPLIEQPELEGYTAEQVGYHSYLLVDAGFAKGVDMTELGDVLPQWEVLHLTSSGHDVADAARSESTWSKATAVVKEKAGGVTLEVMKQVLVSVVKNTLGL